VGVLLGGRRHGGRSSPRRPRRVELAAQPAVQRAPSTPRVGQHLRQERREDVPDERLLLQHALGGVFLDVELGPCDADVLQVQGEQLVLPGH